MALRAVSQRLQRFLREFELDYYTMAKLVIEMMEIPEPWVSSLDRTEWQFGRKVFNILMQPAKQAVASSDALGVPRPGVSSIRK